MFSSRFQSFTANYIRGANGVILVYDVTNLKSFEHLSYWLDLVKCNIPEKTIIFIVGSKNDMTSRKVITTRMARTYAQSNGLKFVQTSAKDTTNVERVFFDLAFDMIKNQKSIDRLIDNTDDVISLTLPSDNDNESGYISSWCGI